MRVVLTETFTRALVAAPPEIPKLFGKQLTHLLRDLRHRSLDAKKFPESGDPDMWSARVNGGWRVYFTVTPGTPTPCTTSEPTPNDHHHFSRLKVSRSALGAEVAESAGPHAESEEIAELRRVVSEITEPEPKSFTTT